MRRPPHRIADILAWADGFHARVGRWPRMKDGKITGQLGLTWMAVNMALAQGHRGLGPGSSLAKLLLEHRGRLHRKLQPRFSIKGILAWADAYHERTGKWPTAKSGRVVERSPDTWVKIDNALRSGVRGVRGGSSLARVLAKHRGVRNPKGLPPLSVKQILAWADAYHKRTRKWPHLDSGPIGEAPGESWLQVTEALRHGTRGLSAQHGSLAQLLATERGVRNIRALPPLALKDIVSWAKAYHARTGKWPVISAGPIPEAPGDTWGTVNTALSQGLRGFRGGSSLAKAISKLREQAARKRPSWRRSEKGSTRQMPGNTIPRFYHSRMNVCELFP